MELSKEHKNHVRTFRRVEVAHKMEDMTKEAIKRRIQDLETRKKWETGDTEDWKISDIGQLQDEYDNRIFRSRV